jgi:glycosyltransferase involved in cell wall biosynthesis
MTGVTPIETLVSIIAPLAAEGGDTVEAFVDETVRVLRDRVTHYEIILVDDGTTDDSAPRARSLLAKHDFLRLLTLSRHFGEETAIAAGLDVAIGDFIIVMLPNMDPPSLIPEFLELARGAGTGGEGVDIVYGVRLHRKNEPFWYRVGANAFYWLINDVLKAELPEDSTQFRCMTRRVVNAITQIGDRDRYLRVLTSYVGFKKQSLSYAPINRNGRPTVRPKGEAVGLARALIIDHTSAPLRLAAWLGFAAGGVMLAIRPSIGSAQFVVVMFVLALLAEYVSGMLRRLRSRPTYYVSEEQNSSVLLREERKNVVHETA